jgi:SAM-dependent methyltransferase
MTSDTTPVRVDLGCGDNKREGFIGLDFVDAPAVDHVLDLTQDRYPFDDSSVDEVFSAHFLEHIDKPDHVFHEVGRIAKDGARLEFWTPYAYSDEAALHGHLHELTEEEWLHYCVLHRDTYAAMLRGRWLLHRINFVVLPQTVWDLEANDVTVDFAIRYFKGVVVEFGVEIEYQSDLEAPTPTLTRSWSTTRFGERHDFAVPGPNDQPPTPAPPPTPGTLRRLAAKLPSSVKTKLHALTR